jgi:hypothetical protein
VLEAPPQLAMTGPGMGKWRLLPTTAGAPVDVSLSGSSSVANESVVIRVTVLQVSTVGMLLRG